MKYNIWSKIISNTTFGQSQKQQQQQLQHPSISIELLESVLYSHQANHPVLRGVVELKSKKPIAVSSLRLDFHGDLDFRIVKPDVSCQKKIAECSLPLYPASPSVIPASSLSKPLVIQDQGDKPTRFVFEMPIPNNTTTTSNRPSSLIQSIQCNEFQVNYQIKAILEYHQLYTTTSHKNKEKPFNNNKKSATILHHVIESPSYPIDIIQIPTYDDGHTIFTSDNMLSSIDSRKQSNKWCQYVVQIDKRFAAISSSLSLSLRIAPLIHGLKLAQVSMQISQRFTIMHPQSPPQSFSRPPIPLECHHQSTPYPSSSTKHHTGGTLYEGEFQYKIPNSSTTTTTISFLDHISNNDNNSSGLVPSIQANTSSDIKVEHQLLVYLAMTYPKMSHDGILRRARRVFTFQCDIDLMADHVSDEFLKLPIYDGNISPTTIYSTPKKHQENHHHRHSVTLANEIANYSRHQSSRPPMYDQAVLLPPAVL